MVRPGDTVFVTSKSGDELKARVVGVVVDRDAFLVDVDEVRLELPASSIREIQLEVRDPLRNGALIGASLGAAIDAAHKGREPIYRPGDDGSLPFIEPLTGSRTRRLEFSITVVW